MTETQTPNPLATAIAPESFLIDLQFQGETQVIAAYLVRGYQRTILIEAGPGSTIDALLAGIGAAGIDVGDLTDLYVTHIHLDHAGAAGLLAAMNPKLKVHTHPFGAPHVADPSKLIASATRIYGDQMDRLWGKWAPIEESRVIPIEDGETIDLGGRTLTAHFTPGHARHHVAYLDQESGDLYAGDIAGIHIPGAGFVLPPTPPPEFDPESWATSIALMRSLKPLRLVPTHFGPVSDPETRLSALESELAHFVEIGEASFTAGEDQDQLTTRLQADISSRVDTGRTDLISKLELASPSYMAAMGLTRYLTKRAQAAAS